MIDELTFRPSLAWQLTFVDVSKFRSFSSFPARAASSNSSFRYSPDGKQKECPSSLMNSFYPSVLVVWKNLQDQEHFFHHYSLDLDLHHVVEELISYERRLNKTIHIHAMTYLDKHQLCLYSLLQPMN